MRVQEGVGVCAGGHGCWGRTGEERHHQVQQARGRQELCTCCAELLPAAPCCWFCKVHQLQLAWGRKRPVSYQPAGVLLAAAGTSNSCSQPSSPPTWQVDECEVHRCARHLHNHDIPTELQARMLTRFSSPQGHACCIPCCCAAVLVVAKAGGRVQGVAFAVVSSSRPPEPSQQAGLCC